MKKTSLFFLLLLTMFSSFAQSFNMVGSTAVAAPGWDFTPAGGSLGALWCTTTIDFSKHFELTFKANFNITSGSGADGICAVFGTGINTAPAPLGTLGSNGGALGYYGGNPAFLNSLAVEFDDFNNSGGYNDIFPNGNDDHTAVVQNGNPAPIPGGGPALINGGAGIKDGLFHDYKIEFCPGKDTLYVYVWGAVAPLLKARFDPVAFWGKPALNFIKWGFTGSDAVSTSNQRIKNIVLNYPLPPTLAPIIGPGVLCAGTTAFYTDATTSGTFSSAEPTVSVSPGGAVVAISPGTATITYTKVECDTERSFISIIVYPNPSALPAIPDLCQGSSTLLTSTPSGGTWSIISGAGVVTINPSTGLVSGVTPGTAIIGYTLAPTPPGCNTSTMVTVVPSPAPITGNPVMCGIGATTSLADITPGGIWSSSDGSVASVDAFGNVTGVSYGVATITYQVPGSPCYSTFPVTVSTVPTPSYFSGKTEFCVGDFDVETMLPGTSGSFTSTWLSTVPSVAYITAPGLTTATLNAASAGVTAIIYSVTNSIGCVGSTLFTATVDPTPAAITGPTLICGLGNSITLANAVPGGIWSSSNISIATVNSMGDVIGVAYGTCDITYSLPGSPCYVFTTIRVAELPTPSIIQWSTEMCVGQTVSEYTIPGTSGAYTESWSSSDPSIAIATSGGLNVGTVKGMSAGTATITYTVTTPLGCSGYATIAVLVDPTPTAISGSTMLCGSGSTTTLSNGVGGGIWSSGNTSVATIDTTGVVTGKEFGTSVITYSLPGSPCFVTATITVNPVPDPGFTLINDQLCVLQTVLESTVPGTTGTFTSAWSSSNPSVATVSPGVTSALVYGVSPGTSIISYSVTNSFGCTGYASITVTVNITAGPITGSTAVCGIGSTTTLANTVGSGVWTSSDLTIATVDPAGVVTGVNFGTATITYSIPGSICYATTTVTVSEVPEPKIIQWSDKACVGQQLNQYIDPGMTGTYTTAWGSSNTLVATVVTGSSTYGIVTAVGPGTAIITCSVTNAAGCTGTASILVTVYPAVAPITGIFSECEGQTTTLASATPGGIWSSSDPSVATVNTSGDVTGIHAGTTTITYTFPGSPCPATVVFTVHETPHPSMDLSANICTGNTRTVMPSPGVTGAASGTWTATPILVATAWGTLTSGTILGSSPGTATIIYTVTTIPYGCVGTAISTVTVNPSPAPITGPSTTVCQGIPLPLSCPTPGGTWSSSNPMVATVTPAGLVNGLNAGTAIITYLMPGNCISLYTVTVVPQLTACVTVGVGYDSWGHASNQLFTFTASTISGTPVTSGVTITYEARDCSGGTVGIPQTYSGTLPLAIDFSTFPSVPGSPICQICVTSITDNASGCTWPLNCCVSTLFSWRRANPAGVKQAVLAIDDLTVVPNPTKGQFTLKGTITGTPASDLMNLEVVDMIGQVIYKDVMTVDNTAINKNISLNNNIANGVYFIRISNGEVSKVIRFSLDR